MSHSLYSPSSSSRWIACNPSLGSQGLPSSYAAQGTVAHGLADNCRLTGTDPSTHNGTTERCDGYEITIDDEMVSNVSLYLEHLSNLELLHGECELEKRIIHSKYPEFGGTVDASFVGGDEVVIVDLKYGAGVFVDVEENVQLGCYALLLLDDLGRDFQDVTAYVVQPRYAGKSPIRSTVLKARWLEELMTTIEGVMTNPSTKRVPGSHCKFCPLKAECPELSQQAMSLDQAEFAQVETVTEAESQERIELVLDVLKKAPQIRDYLNAVTEWAHRHLGAGGELPGYKLVEKFSNRRYRVDEKEILKACRKAGFGKKQCVVTELKSPAQLEKVLGKQKKSVGCVM